jgi:hypothetical protein
MVTTAADLDKLRRERSDAIERAAKIVESASVAGRRLTVEEETAVTAFLDRAAEILDRIRKVEAEGQSNELGHSG